jgi:aerobic C4-dicarboxylate transport protein
LDRFLAEARGVTNLIGNGVATLVISKSENEFKASTQTKNNQLNEEAEEGISKKSTTM